MYTYIYISVWILFWLIAASGYRGYNLSTLLLQSQLDGIKYERESGLSDRFMGILLQAKTSGLPFCKLPNTSVSSLTRDGLGSTLQPSSNFIVLLLWSAWPSG